VVVVEVLLLLLHPTSLHAVSVAGWLIDYFLESVLASLGAIP